MWRNPGSFFQKYAGEATGDRVCGDRVFERTPLLERREPAKPAQTIGAIAVDSGGSSQAAAG
jgi:hypothetical protein